MEQTIYRPFWVRYPKLQTAFLALVLGWIPGAVGLKCANLAGFWQSNWAMLDLRFYEAMIFAALMFFSMNAGKRWWMVQAVAGLLVLAVYIPAGLMSQYGFWETNVIWVFFGGALPVSAALSYLGQSALPKAR